MKLHAFMYTFNESDIIANTVRKLREEGIWPVTIFDNWSTDATVPAARSAGAEVIEFLGKPHEFREEDGLQAVQEAANASDADWCMLVAADEVYRAPKEFPASLYRDMIYLADKEGANVVDHETWEFYPVDNSFHPGDDFEDKLRYYKRDPRYSLDHPQERAWKNDRKFGGWTNPGHAVHVKGKRVYGARGLRKHYPIRSQEHGFKKVMVERFGRGKGCSFTQYNPYRSEQNFIHDKEGLLYDEPSP